jgi:hypothetical protein
MAESPFTEATQTLHLYDHSLIDWGSVIGGTVIAIAIGFTLNLLGVAIGATALNPFEAASDQAPGLTLGGGLWVAFSNLVAIQVGAFVAARAAKHPDHHHGALQGLAVWALSFVIALAALGVGVSGMLAAASNSVHGVAQAATDAAQSATGQASGAPRVLSPDEAAAAKTAAATVAWWAFATMVLGAVGGVAGGKLGAAHPDWHVRNRRQRPVTLADKV